MASATITTGSADCTVDRFRERARETFQPWYQRKSGEWRLRRLKLCSPNQRTLRGMKQIHGNLARGRADAIRRYRELTPYVGLGSRWAIEPYIVSCESGGSWSAYNPSGAVGPYQLLGWGAPFPVDSFKEKMAHHRLARYVMQVQGASAWVCA